MDAPPKTRPRLLDGLTRILHLHRLPNPEPTALPPIPNTIISSIARTPPPSRPSVSAHPTLSEKMSASKRESPASSVRETKTIVHNSSLGGEQIVTDYDRIFDLVKNRQKIKLDEIARLLALKEERIAQELQTLEDNGLIEVNYPAFGEPLICYKDPGA